MTAAAPSSFRGLIGVARREITPPIGIYARCWGAAKHDVAEGVHRPLTLTCMTFATDRDEPLVLIGADLMSWRSRAAENAVIGRIISEANLPRERVMFCLTHNHAAPSVRPEDADKPGGEMIAPYQEMVARAALEAIDEARNSADPATLTWRYGKCDLAANRDLIDGDRMVCGFNQAAPADDTLLVARITADDDGRMTGVIVNYACHPTTLAWENRLLSPDYVGAMREVVESFSSSPCLFLQGASGELAPAEQYTGDVAVAERHGRWLGFAVLSALEAMERPGMQLVLENVVESGAPLAIWRQKASEPSDLLEAKRVLVSLGLKSMPSLAEIEANWRECDDHVMKERLSRQRGVRALVGDGSTADVPLWIWRLGDSILIGQPNEAYSQFQIELRTALAPRAVAVMNLVNGSIGYLAPREMYDKNAYQVWQSPFAAGALETLIETAKREVAR
jgi:hypothetical protein